MDLSRLATERRNPNTMTIDAMSALEIVTTINGEDARVAEAIRPALPTLAALVDATVAAFEAGGRLIYVGAGTSGRLGVLDAVECPPTYGVDPAMVVGLIAGGDAALRQSVEGAEDDETLAARDMDALGVTARDVVVGIAASGRTPYTLAAMRRAREVGAAVGCVVNSPGSPMEAAADFSIMAVVGPEVVTGSTRMKSGTAQKLILNMLSTASMIRLGKVYQNLMVDVQATNQKLVERAVRIVQEAAGVSRSEAEQAIRAYGSAKPAILALLSGVEGDDVHRLLAEHHGRLREALAAAGQGAA
ncbi:MAG: N-acetylmuramic acid 6-phosphate etherase [Anaerolineae bacterium]